MGEDMLNKLDIDKNINIWIPAYKAFIDGEKPICPRCNSHEIEVIQDEDSEGIGFLVLTCISCGKSGYFSRVKFN